MYCNLNGYSDCGMTKRGIRRIIFFPFGDITNYQFLPEDDFYIQGYDNNSNGFEYKPSIDATVNSASNTDGGIKTYAHTLTLFVPKMDYVQNRELNHLLKRGLQAIVEDKNGNCWLLGEDNPLIMNQISSSMGNTSSTNGYQIEMVSFSKKMLSEIACFDGLCRATLRGTEDRLSRFVLTNVSSTYPMSGLMRIIADGSVRTYTPTGSFNPNLWLVSSIKAADVAKLNALISGTGDGFVSFADYDAATDTATIEFTSSNTSFDELEIGTNPPVLSFRSIVLRLQTVFSSNIGQNSTFTLKVNGITIQSGSSNTPITAAGFTGTLGDFNVDVLSLYPLGATFEMELTGAGCPNTTYVYVYEPLTSCLSGFQMPVQLFNIIEIPITHPTNPHILTVGRHQVLVDVTSSSLYLNEVNTQLSSRGVNADTSKTTFQGGILRIYLNSRPQNSEYRCFVDYINQISTTSQGGRLKKAFQHIFTGNADTSFVGQFDPTSYYGGTVAAGAVVTNNCEVIDPMLGNGYNFGIIGGSNVDTITLDTDSDNCGMRQLNVPPINQAQCPYFGDATPIVKLSYFTATVPNNTAVVSVTLQDGSNTITIPFFDGLMSGSFDANTEFFDCKIGANGVLYASYFGTSAAHQMTVNFAMSSTVASVESHPIIRFNSNAITHPFERLQTQIPESAQIDTMTTVNLNDNPVFHYDTQSLNFATESFDFGTSIYSITFNSPTTQTFDLQFITAAGVVAFTKTIPTNTSNYSANLSADLAAAGVGFAALTLRKLKGLTNKGVVYQFAAAANWYIQGSRQILHRVDKDVTVRRRYNWLNANSRAGIIKPRIPAATKLSVCPDFYPSLLGTSKLRFWGQPSGLNYTFVALPQTCTVVNGSTTGTVNGGVYNIGNRIRVNGVILRIINVVGTTLTFGQPYIGANGTYSIFFERALSWSDSSGNGLTMNAGVTGGGTQVASSKRQLLDERDGALMSPGQYFSMASTITNPQKLTFIAAVQFEGLSNSVLFAHRSSNQQFIQLLIENAASTVNHPTILLRDSINPSIFTATSNFGHTNNWNIYTMDFQQNTGSNDVGAVWSNGHYSNRATVNHNFTGNFDSTTWTVGGINTGGFAPGYGGNIIEFCILHNATLDDIQKIEGYFRWKYYKTLTLDTTHPYANSRPPQ